MLVIWGFECGKTLVKLIWPSMNKWIKVLASLASVPYSDDDV